MSAFAGLVLLQVMGAVLRALVMRARVRDSLATPSSLFLALGLLYASALGFVGVVLGTALLVCARLLPRPRDVTAPALLPWTALAVIVVLLVARPWVPSQWDELVWLAKARFETEGFGAGVRAALDPEQRVIPAGYPPLWPAAVGWLSLGVDTLETQVVAAALLVFLCAAVALEAWWPVIQRAKPSMVTIAAVLVAAPVAWVHLRSLYVDLPVGLLGVAVLGFLLTERLGAACTLAVVMTGFKDEGFAHVLAATLGALAVKGVRRPFLHWLAPALLSVIGTVTWRWLLHRHGVNVVDHAVGAPELGWAGSFVGLLARHATDVPTWGLFWAVVAGVLLSRAPTDEVRALRWALVAGVVFIAGALLFGPERVRVFAENGTLLNRLLVQWWPTGAALVLLRLSVAPGAA